MTNDAPFMKELKPKIWKQIYQLVQDNPELSPEDTRAKIAELLVAHSFPLEIAVRLSALVFDRLHANSATSSQAPQVMAVLSQQDIAELCTRLPPRPQKTPPPIDRLLVAFAVFARATPHRSGWIKYDKKLIFYLANVAKFPTAEQESLTRTLHEQHGLNMRVVGSTNPIACFQLDWQASQPNPSLEENATATNPLITLGPLAPGIIEAIARDLRGLVSTTEENATATTETGTGVNIATTEDTVPAEDKGEY